MRGVLATGQMCNHREARAITEKWPGGRLGGRTWLVFALFWAAGCAVPRHTRVPLTVKPVPEDRRVPGRVVLIVSQDATDEIMGAGYAPLSRTERAQTAHSSEQGPTLVSARAGERVTRLLNDSKLFQGGVVQAYGVTKEAGEQNMSWLRRIAKDQGGDYVMCLRAWHTCWNVGHNWLTPFAYLPGILLLGPKWVPFYTGQSEVSITPYLIDVRTGQLVYGSPSETHTYTMCNSFTMDKKEMVNAMDRSLQHAAVKTVEDMAERLLVEPPPAPSKMPRLVVGALEVSAFQTKGRYVAGQLVQEVQSNIPVFLRTALADAGFPLADRRDLEQVLKELGITRSALFDEDNVKKVGSFAAADAIVTGEVTTSEDGVSIDIKAIDVQTAVIWGTAWVKARQGGDELRTAAEDLAAKLADSHRRWTQRRAAQLPKTEPKTDER